MEIRKTKGYLGSKRPSREGPFIVFGCFDRSEVKPGGNRLRRFAVAPDGTHQGLVFFWGGIFRVYSLLNLARIREMGAPSLPRLCFCGKGGIAQTPIRHFQLTTELGAPGHDSETWDRTNPDPPLSTHHRTGCPRSRF